MKVVLFAVLGIASVACLLAQPSTESVTEPTYGGQPIKYWLDLYRDGGGSNEVEITKAFTSLGFKSLSSIINWPWKSYISSLGDQNLPTVQKAFRSFTLDDKKKLLVELCLPERWQSRDDNVRALLIAFAPSRILLSHGIDPNTVGRRSSFEAEKTGPKSGLACVWRHAAHSARGEINWWLDSNP
jgi:hypothetical protein